jgi:transcriptional regulator of arginine metabolism
MVMHRDRMIPRMTATTKHERQARILEIVGEGAVGSQHELVDRLESDGLAVTQATVSRDVAELGLVRVRRGDRLVYVPPGSLAGPGVDGHDGGAATALPARDPDAILRRILADIPVRVARSGLTLVLIGTPGTAGFVGQAIDASSLRDQVGTLAGDDTVLVLFADEPALLRGQLRFAALQPGR